jgi:hypothetical protein
LVLLLGCSGKRFDNPFDPKNRPPGPAAISPAEGAEIADNPPDSIAWAPVGDSAFYHLQVDDDSVFSSPLANDSLLRAPSKRLSEALPYGWAYWRVRAAQVKGAWGNWSGRHCFFCKFGVVYRDADFPNGELAMDQGRLCVSHSMGFDFYSLQDPVYPLRLGGGQEVYWSRREFQRGYVYSLIAECWPYELRIYDARNPQAPVQVGVYPCSTNAALKVEGSHAYLLGRFYRDTMLISEIRILDVYDPAQIRRLGQWDTLTSLSFNSATVVGGVLYSTAYQLGLMAFDCRNPQAPYLASTIAGLSGFVLLSSGNRLYVCTGGGIVVLDISDPLHPARMATLPTYANHIQVEDTRLVSLGGYRVTIQDVANPNAPSPIGSVLFFSSSHYQYLTLFGDYAYMSGESGLAVVRVR